MAFQFRKGKTRPLETKIVKGSEVLQIGEAVRLDTAGLVVTCPAGSTVYGVVQGIVGDVGQVPTTNGGSGAFDPHGSYTFSATNATVEKYQVQIQTSPEAIYSVTADAALGTTTGSNLAGYYMDHASGGLTLTENTAATTTAQWFSHGLDPEDTTNRVLVSINESQLVIS